MENKQNKIVHESHEFLEENPVQDWEKRKKVDGFDFLKEKAKEKENLLKEFQDNQRSVQQKFDEKFKEEIQTTISLQVNLTLKKIEEFLRKEGLIRRFAADPKIVITYAENKILMEITIKCISYYNFVDQNILSHSSRYLDSLSSESFDDESNEQIEFKKSYKISAGKELVF